PKLDRTISDKRVAKQELGWDPDLFTVLVSGSKRVEGLPEALHVLNHFGKEMQLAIVCGRDTELFNELRTVDWHQKVHLFEFTKRMPDLMAASDLMICKAGGLSVTEALASGLPMILINVLPGQEVGNMEYAVENGAAIHAESKDAILEAMAHLTQNDNALLDEMASNSCRLGRSHAAYDAADVIWDVAQLNVGGKVLAQDPNILNLLRLNRINWTDYGKLDAS
ncbi:MAG TPA: glycosyltransferase, partial [Bellilinea sp.]|nr:glycosyltransferase [Bellilinea sp.]